MDKPIGVEATIGSIVNAIHQEGYQTAYESIKGRKSPTAKNFRTLTPEEAVKQIMTILEVTNNSSTKKAEARGQIKLIDKMIKEAKKVNDSMARALVVDLYSWKERLQESEGEG